ncbi:short-chain dehydrogenase/reductase SDR [Rhodotorula diobovata]|uniref:Short-chain dehydrogenase/reductase SDR n=1 Tax=Rhodotorula diobovata TaxID=5288 RepID=A0A5C5G3X2_9BASI|nr:short-chain dehydrogenase/reductase SDR [Rhodotorula diobovata]
MASTSPRRIACVTGASSGIGRASAVALAAAGWTVVISGRRQGELDETIRLARERTQEAQLVAVVGDLGKPEEVDALFEVIRERFGRLDLLFNNAGRGLPAVPLQDVPLDDFQSIVAINLVAPFLCTQHAFRIMRDQSPQGGRIINNGSISAHAPRPLSAPYTLTKHAITGLTKSTALDGRAYNIACSQIDIGNAQSAMVDELRRGAGSLQPNGDRMHEPVMPVEHVADAVVHTASLPLHVNILTQTIMATQMPFVGRG